MTVRRGDGPQLTRLGGGRSARMGTVVAVALIVVAVGVAFAERLPTGIGPRLSQVALAPTPLSSSPTPPGAVATPPATPRNTIRGDDSPWERHLTPGVGVFLDAALLNHDRIVHRLRLEGSSGARSSRLSVPPELWRLAPRVQLRWSDGRLDGRREQVAIVGLSLGTPERPGFPIELAAGNALLPQPLDGSRHWRYSIVLERASQYAAPTEWIVHVEMEITEAPVLRPAGPAAPLILLTASPGHPLRATRTHGASWVAGR